MSLIALKFVLAGLIAVLLLGLVWLVTEVRAARRRKLSAPAPARGNCAAKVTAGGRPE